MQTTGLLDSNKDWKNHVEMISRNTEIYFNPLWEANIRANVKRVKDAGWAVDHCWEAAEGKTVIMIGASPALEKHIDKLRDLQYDPDFVLFGISSGVSYLVKHGIYPKYVFITDAQKKIERWFEGVTEADMKRMTLIANIFVHPEVLDAWKGEIKYLALWTGDKKLDKLIPKLYDPINGNGDMFHALSSQYNTGTAFAYLVMQARIIIFVGNELSFPTEHDPYYIGRTDEKDNWIRLPHPDIYGKVAYTGHMLVTLKLVLEDYLGKLPGWFFNATEAGIFGVSKRYGNLPWIKQFKLDMALAHARSIMKTGHPIYDPVSIQ